MTAPDHASSAVTRAIRNTPGSPGSDDAPTGQEILARLLELTPPPPSDAAAEQLLAAFEAVLAERAAVIATIVAPVQLTDGDRALLIELEHRQTAWQEALTTAQRVVGEQRRGISQLRAYAPTV